MVHVKQNRSAVNDLKLSKSEEQYHTNNKKLKQLFMARGPLTIHTPQFGNTVRMSFFTPFLLCIKSFSFKLFFLSHIFTSSFHP